MKLEDIKQHFTSIDRERQTSVIDVFGRSSSQRFETMALKETSSQECPTIALGL
jgi:hypothetical protein